MNLLHGRQSSPIDLAGRQSFQPALTCRLMRNERSGTQEGHRAGVKAAGSSGSFCRKIPIDSGGGLSTFGNSPNDQRLAAAHVACSEDAVDGGHIIRVGSNVSAIVDGETKLLN